MKFTDLIKAGGFFLVCFSVFAISAKAASAVFDYDGDGKTDPVVIRQPSNGSLTWYVLQSRDGFKSTAWGVSPTSPSEGDATNGTIGDYDGDGKYDLAVVRRSSTSNQNLAWFILNSNTNTMKVFQWGLISDRRVPKDYDGDGKTDVAVYRNGAWYVLRSSDGQLYAEQFGTSQDRPLAGGDYDGDGKADLAVIRYGQAPFPGGAIPTTLYLRRSLDGTWVGYNLGDARITGVLTGDYDGDGKADVAMWQGNLWLWIRSSDNQAQGVRFGLVPQDMPAPGDYDGDGKTDPAVYRRGNGACGSNDTQSQSYFYVLGSSDGFKAIQWGLTCDGAPATFDYVLPIGF
jgi:FG-GAP-like repeat